MKNSNATAASGRLADERDQRAALDRIAEESSENEGMAEHVQKGIDPVRWEEQRNERTRSDQPINTVSFEIEYRTGVWQVSREGSFFGDFLSEEEAWEYTRGEVAKVACSGGSAVLTYAS